MARAAEKPLDGALIRALAVIKCWNIREAFDPTRFLERLRSSQYDWDDLRQLIRRSERIVPEKMIASCEQRYQFLLALSENERRLMADAKRHQRKDLPRTLLKEALG